MKKKMAVILAAAMALSITACGSKTETTATTAAAAAQTEAQAAGAETTQAEAASTGYPKAGTVGTFFIGGSVGAGGDLNMRTLIRYLEPKMGITLVPQNVTGSRTIYNAVKNMLKEPADGYTFAYLLYPHCIAEQFNPSTKDNMYALDDYYTMCNLVSDSALIAVRADDPRFEGVNDLKGLVDYLTETGDSLLISACSVAGDDDITVHKIMMGIPEIADQLTIVNGDAVSDGITSLLGGTLDVFTGNVGDVGTLVEDGSIRVISVFAEERSKFLPDVPTAKECGYDIINSTSRGVVLSKDIDQAILDQIQAYIEEVVEDPTFLADMESQGFEVNYLNPEEYRAWLQKEYDEFPAIAEAYGWQ